MYPLFIRFCARAQSQFSVVRSFYPGLIRAKLIHAFAFSTLGIILVVTQPVFAMSVTACPVGFNEVQKTDVKRVCDYSSVLTQPFTGRPSQTTEGVQLIRDAELECRRTGGAFVDGGDRGANAVFLVCDVPLSDEEIAKIEEERRAAEEEAERRRQEEAAANERRAERERRRRERDARVREEQRLIDEQAQEERRQQLEAERLEREARNAPFVFDQADEIRLSAADSSVASSLVALCSSLRGRADLSVAQNDLVERCIDINREEADSNKALAISEVAAKQYSDIGQSLAFLNTIQVGNIGGRLAAITPSLRQNAKDVASVELNHPNKGLLAASPSSSQVGGSAGDDDHGRFGVFVLGTTGDGDKDASRLSNGFDYRSTSMTFGVDYLVDVSTIVGLAYGYGSTDSEFTGGSGSMDISSDTYTLYAAKALKNRFSIDAIIGVGDVDTESVRNMTFTANDVDVNHAAKSDIKSDQKLISIGVSKAFEAWLNIDIGARFNYIETDINRFSEGIDSTTPGFGLALEIDRYKLKSTTSDVSVNVSKAVSADWGVWIPQARFSWVHEFESGDRSLRGRFLADTSTVDFAQSGLEVARGGGSTLFSVPLEKLDADYGNLLVGVNALLPRQFSLNASINKTLGIRDFDHVYWTLSARKDF